MANRLKISFIPIRKKGKLPGETISRDFKLEYGSASMEIKNESLMSIDKPDYKKLKKVYVIVE